jgi:hypothetical protein
LSKRRLTQSSFNIESSFKSSTDKNSFKSSTTYDRLLPRPSIDDPEYIQTINGRHVIIFGTFGDEYEADVLEWDWFWLRKRSEKY